MRTNVIWKSNLGFPFAFVCAFSKKHNVLARNDYWKTASECPSCAVVCNSDLGLKKHKKLCRFAKTGYG